MGLWKIIFGDGGTRREPHKAVYVDDNHIGETLSRHADRRTGEVKGVARVENVHDPSKSLDLTKPSDD